MDRPEKRLHPLLIPALVAVLGLNACADGGAIIASGEPCGVELTSPAGIWIGSGNFIGGGTTVAMISGGNLVVLQLTGDNPLNLPFVSRYYIGQYNPVTLAGTADVYNQFGRLLSPNQELRIGVASTLNVTVGAPTTLMPMCPMADGTGSAIFNRPSVTQEGANLIAGTWQFEETTQAGTSYTLTYTIDATGNLLGNDSPPGCIYDGRWLGLGPQRNLYRFDAMSLDSPSPGACDTNDPDFGPINFDGDGYNGFAFILDPDPNQARVLWTVVANGRAAYFIRLERTSAPPNQPPPGDDDDEF